MVEIVIPAIRLGTEDETRRIRHKNDADKRRTIWQFCTALLMYFIYPAEKVNFLTDKKIGGIKYVCMTVSPITEAGRLYQEFRRVWQTAYIYDVLLDSNNLWRAAYFHDVLTGSNELRDFLGFITKIDCRPEGIVIKTNIAPEDNPKITEIANFCGAFSAKTSQGWVFFVPYPALENQASVDLNFGFFANKAAELVKAIAP